MRRTLHHPAESQGAVEVLFVMFKDDQAAEMNLNNGIKRVK